VTERIILFPNVSSAEANVYAENLAGEIRDIDESVQVKKRRTNSEAMDFGASLVIILGSASASAIASGIASWMTRHSGVRLEIRNKSGELVAANLDSKDAAAITESFSESK